MTERLFYFADFARKRMRQRQRSDVTSCAMRFVGIVSDVFLNYANDLNGGCCAGQTDHPVLFRYTQ